MPSSVGGTDIKGPADEVGSGSAPDPFATLSELTSHYAADSHPQYAMADGSRPSSAKSSTAPTSPVDGEFWTRSVLSGGKKKTLFIYDAIDGVWYAQDGVHLSMNRNSVPSSNGDWLGMHRLNALSSQARAVRFNRNIYWHSASIAATNTPSATMGVVIEIGGSDVHTISWDGVNGDISDDIAEFQAKGDGIRAYVTVGVGTAPDNVQLFLEGQEYV